LIEDIERLQSGQPVRARPDSAGYRLRKFVSRNRLAVGAATAVFLAVLLGAGGALWQARAAAIERDRALALLERSQTALDFMEVVISEAVPVGEKVSRSELLERSERIATRSFSANPEHLALVLSMLASHYNSHSDRVKASALIERATELVSRSPDLALRAEIECERGVTMALLGRLADGKAVIESWLARADLDPPTAAQCQLYLVQIALTNDDAKAALANALEAQQRLAQATRPPPMLQASSLADLAYAESINGRNDLADRDYAAASKIYKDMGREHGFAYLAILNNWGVAAFDSGDIQRAVQIIEETLRLSDGGAGGAKPPPYIVSNHAFALATLARYPQALAEAKRAFELARDVGAVEFKVRALLTQAQVHRELGDLKQAQVLIDAAAVEAAEGAPRSLAAISVQINRARLALMEQRAGDALALLVPAMQRLEQDGNRTVAVSNALRVRAEARWQRGDTEGAIVDAQRAVDIARDAQGGKPHSYITGQAWLLLGRIEQDAGHAAAARSALQSAVEHLSATLGDDHPETRKARLALGA
jgi:serine/threonine-protein kinase